MKNKATFLEGAQLSGLSSLYLEIRKLLPNPSKHSKAFHLIEKLSVIVEYCQLFSLILLFSVTGAQENDQSFYIMNFIVKIMDTLSLNISHENDDIPNYSIGVIFCVFGLTLLKYTLQVYVSILSLQKLTPNRVCFFVWKWCFSLQVRIIMFFTVSFCFNIIQIDQDQISNFGSSLYYVIKGFAIGIMTIEYGFSILINIKCSSRFPTGQFFSAKSTTISTLTITLKFVLLIIKLVFPSASTTRGIVILAISLLFCIVQDKIYFTTFPPYKLKAIHFKGHILALITLLDLCLLLNLIISYTDTYTLNSNITLTMWITIAPLGVILTRAYINKVFRTLKTHNTPELAIQKLKTIKHMVKSVKFDHNHQIEANFDCLVYKGLSFKMGYDLHTNVVGLIETLNTRFPNSEISKLFVAYYYGIKLKIYASALRILVNLERVCSSTIYIDCILLKALIQETMQNEMRNKNVKLNIWKALHDRERWKTVKNGMLLQAEAQLDLYKELQHQTPDLGKILKFAQKIDLQKQIVINQKNMMIQTVCDSYIQPFFMFAHYSLTLNHSQLEYMQYNKMYIQKYERYRAALESNSLTQGTIYNKDIAFLILDTDGGPDKKIIHCSESVQKVTGWEPRSLVGHNISVLLPMVFSSACFDRVEDMAKGESCDMGNEVFQSFGYHKNKTLMEFAYSLDIYPILDKGFYLNLVLRRVHSDIDYAVVDESGAIISITSKLAEKLEVNPHSPNIDISSLSTHLGRANKACDMYVNNDHFADIINGKSLTGSSLINNIKFLKKTRTLKESEMDIVDYEQAQKIYDRYHSEGKVLDIKSVKAKNEYTFCCKLTYKTFEDTFFKIFSFEEVCQSDLEGSETAKLSEIKSQITEEVQEEGDLNDDVQMKEDIISNDEKRGGWIDVGKLTKNDGKLYGLIPLSPSESRKALTSITIDERYTEVRSEILAKDATLRPKKYSKFLQDIPVSPTNSAFVKEFKEKEKESNDQDPNAVMRYRYKESKASSSLATSHQREVYKAFSTALDVKYYDISFTRFVLIFYFILMVIFSVQMAFHITAKTNFGVLIARKNIISEAEAINDCLIRIQRDSRLTLDLYQGKLDENVLTLYNSTTSILIGKIRDDFNAITLAYHQLLNDIPSLNQEDHTRIFETEIVIHEVNDDGTQGDALTLDRFQALETIIEQLSAAINNARVDVSKAVPYLEFVLLNGLNDFLVQGEDLSSFFFNISVDEQNERSTLLDICFGNIFAILALNLFLVVLFIYKQYIREKRNLVNLTKLKETDLESLQGEVTSFIENLKQENFAEKLQTLRTHREKVKPTGPLSGKEHSKKVTVKAIQFKYVVYGSNLVTFLLVLLGLLIGIFELHGSTITFSISKLTQLYFTEEMRAKINIGVTAAFELYALNDTNTIRNEPVSSEFAQIIEDINTVLLQIPDNFQNDDNAAVQNILFKDGCQYFYYTDSATYQRCVNVRNGAPSISLLVLISNLESSLKLMQEMFYESNRATEALGVIMTNMFPITVVPNRVVYSLTSLLAKLKDADFESDITTTQQKQDIINGILDALFIVVSGLVWIRIFRQIRESDNQIKKVLKTLPLNMILSNFMLKNYLLKTSKGIFDLVKKDM